MGAAFQSTRAKGSKFRAWAFVGGFYRYVDRPCAWLESSLPRSLAPAAHAAAPACRIDHVADGDTVTLTNGQRVRIVQFTDGAVTSGGISYGAVTATGSAQLYVNGHARNERPR